MAKLAVEKYGYFAAVEMVDEFFELRKWNPHYKNAPLTLTCWYSNRNDIVGRVKEKFENLGREEKEDRYEF